MQTEICKISSKITAEDQKTLERAALLLKNGGLVVFPTETVYGIGGDALSKSSAEKMYRAKGRPSDNPLIIHVAHPEDATRYAEAPPMYFRLAERFMPGPLTVVMPVAASVPNKVTAGLSTVAVRCPVHPVAHALLKTAGIPIAAPSANLSGSPSPTCARHVIEDMDGRVDMILVGEDADYGVESTIVKIEEDGGLLLLRPGAVTLEDLRELTDNVRVADAVMHQMRAGDTVLSPGMKYKHYAPKTPTLLLSGSPSAVQAFLKRRRQETSFAVLTYEEDMPRLLSFLPEMAVISFGKREDTRTQAHRLFYLLREADKLGVSEIYAPLPATEGMGLALYNRMIRASAHKILTLTENGEVIPEL